MPKVSACQVIQMNLQIQSLIWHYWKISLLSSEGIPLTCYKFNSHEKFPAIATELCLSYFCLSASYTAQKVSVVRVFLVHIFLHSDWSKSLYSVQMRKNMDQKNSKYRHFSHTVSITDHRRLWLVIGISA